ncbi:MAG: methyltransferase [Gammaproteobacteria bacterium]|nr:methyltransferase [Gammaproteobacteria bacterium]
MNTRKHQFIIAVLALISPALAFSQLSQIQQKVREVMAMDHRSEAELARDADRDPVNAVDFMGLEADMTVIEFIPAAQAYYTKILGPVLRDNGHLMAIDTEGTFDRWGDWIEMPEMGMVHPVPIDNQFNRDEGRYMPGELNFGVPDGTVDKFLYIREYHNFNAEDKARINAKAFDSLKSGGEYVIIDHTKRHMESNNGANGRREDPVSVIHEVQRAGFVLDRVSDMFAKESDDLSLEVGQIPNMTDRFFLVFRKP